MTETMMKLIEEMKALEAILGKSENSNDHINPLLESVYTLDQVKRITEESYLFKNTTDLYEVGFDINEIKYA